ncbi:hypothetical protein ACHAWF_011102, partial [Thalassiosira exigua]
SPKREWRGVDLLGPVAEACGLDGPGDRERVGFETDVNAPAWAEFRHRRHLQENERARDGPPEKPLTSLSYVTVGTGVGVGLVINSRPVHGLLHPEGGQVAVKTLEDDAFGGYSWGEKCPYGGKGTVEGVASSVALAERLLETEEGAEFSGNKEGDVVGATLRARESLAALPDDHCIWDHAANALANLCVSILLLTSCQKIVLGGGVMKRTALFDRVRRRTWTLLNGYLDSVEELSDEGRLRDVIVGGTWEGDGVGSGVAGAYALALDALEGGGREGDGALGRQGAMSMEKREEEEKRSFTLGVLAGIGLSFGCALLTSLLGRGPRRGR